MVEVNGEKTTREILVEFLLMRILLPILPSQVENNSFQLGLVNERPMHLVSRNHHRIGVQVLLLVHTVMRHRTAITLSDYHNELVE